MKLPAKIRRNIILDAAIRVANRDGLLRVTWDAVAIECEPGTTGRTVRAYYQRYQNLWNAIAVDERFFGDRMGYRV